MDAVTAAVGLYARIVFEPEDIVEIRLLPGRRQRWVKASDLQNIAPELCFDNTKGEQNIYVGVNGRTRDGGSTAEDVALARCLVIDFDGITIEEARDRVAKASLPNPSLLVSSGHGFHFYWRLTSPVTDLSIWTSAQKRLIELCKSDPSIHDPPRILRLPGFWNMKGEPVPCEIVEQSDARHELRALVGEVRPVERIAPTPTPVSTDPKQVGNASNLSRQTLSFMADGATQGERNKKLFDAACDHAGNGFGIDEAYRRLEPAALRSGLDPREIRQAITSAYGQPRTPAIQDDDDIGSALQRMAKPNADGTAPATHKARTVSVAEAPTRPVLSNVVDDSYKDADGNDVTCRYYRPLPQIAAELNEISGGWPRRVGGLLFVVKESDRPIPDPYDTLYFKNAAELFGWVEAFADKRWADRDAIDAKTKKKRSPVRESVFFEYLEQNATPNYRSVEYLPHEPPIPNVFYVPCHLPESPGGTETPLARLLSWLNPAEEIDRTLMLAAMLTPGWGGPPGARPAFCFTSDHGRGVGKTITAQLFAELWGGVVSIGAQEDWEDVRKRLLDDASKSARVCLIDNVRGKLEGAGIESMITASQIDGKKMYVGQTQRDNFLTFYLTSNTPRLSTDLATRSVIIKLGAQQHDDRDFLTRWRTFVAEHRPTILAELLAILRGKQYDIRPEHSDRWGAWRDGVLRRIPTCDEAAEIIVSRRKDVDVDSEEAEAIAAAVISMVKKEHRDYNDKRVFITTEQLHAALLRESLVGTEMGRKGVTTWVLDRSSSDGPLHFIRKYKSNSRRGWVVVGENAPLSADIVDCSISPELWQKGID